MMKTLFFLTIVMLSSSVQALELTSVKEQIRAELWEKGVKQATIKSNTDQASSTSLPKLNEELIRAMVKYQL